ncbi:NUDIX hydrolase [Mesorhizobium sp. CN2-181]|uniref:NUDIX hydrolase n=1 Tax=Mesorhizobium yinganensis TaxID=3157707 RepID=UPI0032B71A96
MKQIGALPFRRDAKGAIQFLLVTSRGTRRFVIPKGWRMRKLSDREAAAKEAMQEAGVLGTTASKPIGRYFYWKRLKKFFVPITVAVYPLEVNEEMSTWREQQERLREWVTAGEAMTLVDEPELIHILDEADHTL